MLTTSTGLLERLRRPGDADAWGRFVELYTPLLYLWARRLGLQDADAADLMQDVFVQLMRKLPEFAYDRSGSFRGWLHALLVNRWRDRPRRPGPVPAADRPVPDPAQQVDEAEHRAYLVGRALRLMRSDFQENTWRACWECAALGRPA